MTGTNTLAYFVTAKVTKKTSFIDLPPGRSIKETKTNWLGRLQPFQGISFYRKVPYVSTLAGILHGVVPTALPYNSNIYCPLVSVKLGMIHTIQE